VILEGHYLETIEGLFFAVKGIKHPPSRVIAYLRYVPDSQGTRILKKSRYKRLYDLNETKKILQKRFPHYLTYIKNRGLTLQNVPLVKIKNIHSPKEKLKKIIKSPMSKLNLKTRRFSGILARKTNLDRKCFGVTGSQLIDLDTEDSDIDLLVYGEENGLKVYHALRKLREKSNIIQTYDDETVKKVSRTRWGAQKDIKILQEIEKKKILHGVMDETDYFIRLIWIPEEMKQEEYSKPIKKIDLEAIIQNDSQKIFTPCIYEISENFELKQGEKIEISQIISFRGKFTEQVKKGDSVKIRGTLEKVRLPNEKKYRLVLGDKEDLLLPI
jgi:predicted nucleotidyltransferase